MDSLLSNAQRCARKADSLAVHGLYEEALSQLDKSIVYLNELKTNTSRFETTQLLNEQIDAIDRKMRSVAIKRAESIKKKNQIEALINKNKRDKELSNNNSNNHNGHQQKYKGSKLNKDDKAILEELSTTNVEYKKVNTFLVNEIEKLKQENDFLKVELLKIHMHDNNSTSLSTTSSSSAHSSSSHSPNSDNTAANTHHHNIESSPTNTNGSSNSNSSSSSIIASSQTSSNTNSSSLNDISAEYSSSTTNTQLNQVNNANTQGFTPMSRVSENSEASLNSRNGTSTTNTNMQPVKTSPRPNNVIDLSKYINNDDDDDDDDNDDENEEDDFNNSNTENLDDSDYSFSNAMPPNEFTIDWTNTRKKYCK